MSQRSSRGRCRLFLDACGTSKTERKHNLQCIDLIISDSLAELKVSGCEAVDGFLLLLFGSIEMSGDQINMFRLVFVEHESFWL